jgi:hypothetical protein
LRRDLEEVCEVLEEQPALVEIDLATGNLPVRRVLPRSVAAGPDFRRSCLNNQALRTNSRRCRRLPLVSLDLAPHCYAREATRGPEMRYWDSVLSGLNSRRRALAATGSAGLGTVLLAVCGRGGGTLGSQSCLLTEGEDNSANAVPGGTWRTTDVAEPTGSTSTISRRFPPAARPTSIPSC